MVSQQQVPTEASAGVPALQLPQAYLQQVNEQGTGGPSQALHLCLEWRDGVLLELLLHPASNRMHGLALDATHCMHVGRSVQPQALD